MAGEEQRGKRYFEKFSLSPPPSLPLILSLHPYPHSTKEALFNAHLPLESLTTRVRNKEFYKGVIRSRASREGDGGHADCYVVIHGQRKGEGAEKDKEKGDRWSVSIQGKSLCVNVIIY
jgi:hypothetical protein